MANTKITDLTAASTPLDPTDVTIVVQDVGGTPVSRKVDFADFKGDTGDTGATGPAGPQGPAGSLSKLSVADIDDPSTELASETGATGDFLLVYEDADPSEVTLYTFDSTVTASTNSPYVVAGTSGKWIATSGKYQESAYNVNGNIVVAGTVDGRDVATDGTKLDGIDTGAEVNADLASQAEAEAGAENTKTMTSLRVSQAIAAQGAVPFDANVKTELFDEFVTGNGDTDELGAYGWRRTSAGTGNQGLRLAAESGHPGIYRMVGGTAGTARSAIYLGDATQHTVILGGGEITYKSLIRQTGTLGNWERSMHGLALTLTTVGTWADGVYIEIDRLDTNWHLVCANGGTRTRLDTGIAYVSGNWVEAGFVINAGATSVQAVINGSNAGSPVTTNIPTAVLAPNFKTDALAAGGGTASELDVDFFRFEQPFTSNRYD